MGYGLDRDIRTMTGESAIRGYGPFETQPHYILHNLPATFEVAYLEYLGNRADFLDWDNSFPADATDLTIHCDSQTPLTIEFYSVIHNYFKPTTIFFI